jgi:ribosomal protein L4
MRLLALKIMLSAKLFEDRIIFVDSEELAYPKTQLLEAIVAPFKQDKLCFLIGSESANNNFALAARNL